MVKMDYITGLLHGHSVKLLQEQINGIYDHMKLDIKRPTEGEEHVGIDRRYTRQFRARSASSERTGTPPRVGIQPEPPVTLGPLVNIPVVPMDAPGCHQAHIPIYNPPQVHHVLYPQQYSAGFIAQNDPIPSTSTPYVATQHQQPQQSDGPYLYYHIFHLNLCTDFKLQ